MIQCPKDNISKQMFLRCTGVFALFLIIMPDYCLRTKVTVIEIHRIFAVFNCVLRSVLYCIFKNKNNFKTR